MDINPIKIGLSKTVSASEPSLLFALNQSPVTVNVTEASEISKYLQPRIRSETPLSFSQSLLDEPECKSIFSLDEPLDFHSHDLASLNSVRSSSERSSSVEDSNHQIMEITHTSSIQLDQPKNHKEEGYCEVDGIISDLEETVLLSTNTSVQIGISTCKHSSEYKGYIDYGNLAYTSINTLTKYDFPDSDGVSDSVISPLINVNNGSNLQIRDLANELEQDAIDDCAVVFDFGISTVLQEDEYDNQVAVQTFSHSAGLETSSAAVAFDFGILPSDNVRGTDDHVVTLLEEAAVTVEADQQHSNEASESGFVAGSFHDSIILEEVECNNKVTETGYMVSLDSGVSFKLSSDHSTNLEEEDLCTNLETDNSAPLTFFHCSNNNPMQPQPFSNTENSTCDATSSGYVSGGTLCPNSGLSTDYMPSWFT